MTFHAHGALGPTSPLFRGRTEELARLVQLCQGEVTAYVIVYGGRQTGKTSLLLRLKHQLPETVRVCHVNFQGLPGATAPEMYTFLAQRIASVLPLNSTSATVTDPPSSLKQFLIQALGTPNVAHLVVLLDELGALPDTTRKELGNVLRDIFHDRLIIPALAKLQIVLTGSIELHHLVITEVSTLHNICEEIYLGDLDEADAVALIADGLAAAGFDWQTGIQVGQAVYALVQGHPYLTQRLGSLLDLAVRRGAPLTSATVQQAVQDVLQNDPLLKHLWRSLHEQGLEDAAQRLLTAPRRGGCSPWLRSMLEDAAQRLLTTPPRISRFFDEELARLELLGLAKKVNGQWEIRNPLIARVVREWLKLEPGPPLRVPPLPADQPASSKNTSPGWKIAVRTLTSAGSFVISLCNATRRHFYGNHFFGVLMRQNRPVLLTLLALPLLAAVAILIVREWLLAPNIVTVPIGTTGQVLELIEIPTGPFLMGSHVGDPVADEDQKPQHELTLDSYWIGKTEVTNAQFRPFVEGDGYTNAAYWTEAGWAWRTDEDIRQPRWWDDPQWNGDAQPVVGISWYEAVAYCRWLSAQTGHPFRLPTEAEWEKAARGPDGRIWPWGNEWMAERANSAEAGMNKTTPVGSYPEGASPYGLLDMAGNVWEWTATQWRKDYPYMIEDEWTEAYLAGDASRALRGGSWYNDEKHVRGAYRDNYVNPRYRFINHDGLRLASPSLPLTTDTPPPPATPPATMTTAPIPTDTPQPPTPEPITVVVPIGTTGQVLELIEIPTGPFLMGSHVGDPVADEGEKPQHELTLDSYWIGKTEVTNAQFRPFVEGDGYTNAAYWTEAGWAWRTDEDIRQPRWWDDPQWNGDAQPVVGVSWYEAVAYTNWMNAQTSHPFRLPTEAEWEKAARGPDGRIWPWGNEWMAGHANSAEAGMNKTTPVGSYPEGASPYGLLDMAGNVWEWTATQWRKDYPYTLEDEWTEAYLVGDASRALRSGAWYNDQKHVRGAYRLFSSPRLRFYYYGLRLASDSLPPGHSQ